MLFRTRLSLTLLAGCIFFTTSYARAGEALKITYQDVGKGKPLVLIHAFPTDKRLWLPQQSLQRYFRVITLDLPGFGDAPATNGQAITMTEYADAIKQLLDKLQIKQAIIGGESMGGYIGLAFLKKYPQTVTGLILANTQTLADEPSAKIERARLADEVMAKGSASLIKKFLANALSPHASPKTRQALNEIVTEQSPQAIASALRGMALREDTTQVLADTNLPILIITGDADTVISPKQSQRMQRFAKNSKLIILRAGHLSNLEQAEKWNQAVIARFN